MTIYSKNFAKLYLKKWINYPKKIAPSLLAYYEALPISQNNRHILDLCCGTGEISRFFLDRGYTVAGLDISPEMLRYAVEQTGEFIRQDKVLFVLGDASNFAFHTRFGLVVSVSDSLQHLDGFAAIKQCFCRVFDALDDNGLFIFDFTTRLGFTGWNNIQLTETASSVTVIRGAYDEIGNKAINKVTAFMQNPDGLYERADQTLSYTAISLDDLKNALIEIGWRSVNFNSIDDLTQPLENPEAKGRIFVIAVKG